MRYFQAVVRLGSFTEAAEECYISQSAISQQIQALERELGAELLKREGRKFSLTEAGKFFYQKSLVLLNDFDCIWKRTQQIAGGTEHILMVGVLRDYRGQELQQAILAFRAQRPEVVLHMVTGSHEELYYMLRTGQLDVALNDLRRNPSEEYVNYELAKGRFYAAIAAGNPLTQLAALSPEELKNMPCILVALKGEEHDEEMFYREYLGVKGAFLFAESVEEARLMLISGRGYAPSVFSAPPAADGAVAYVPLLRRGAPLYRSYYAFWRAHNEKSYIEDFAALVKAQFPAEERAAP